MDSGAGFEDVSLVSSGVAELDIILNGGFEANRLYLIEGNPGTGKTTLALQILLQGAAQGERGLYVALSETKSELEGIARSHGWNLDPVDVHELSPPVSSLDADSQYSMFHPSEVELAELTRSFVQNIEQISPRRVVIDSLSEMRLLAQDPLRYRRQILALKQFLADRDCTVFLLDDKTSTSNDLQLQSLVHGVLSLEHMLAEYGGERRRLRIIKLRGRQYQSGYHDFSIQRGGLEVYPRSMSLPDMPGPKAPPLLSGNASLDALLGDGLTAGSSALVLGPTGIGKSSCATLYAVSAARRGDRAALFVFDESVESLLARADGLNMELRKFVESGHIVVERVDPGDLSPGEFAHRVRQSVQPVNGQRTSVVVIDSINGYLNAMPEERFLTMQLHELLMYLNSCGVVTFLIIAQYGMLGSSVASPLDASYLSDTVVLFRYFEADGEIRRAVSVVKKRSGGHERNIREFSLANGRLTVGEPLRDFHGILTGTPTFVGNRNQLLRPGDE